MLESHIYLETKAESVLASKKGFSNKVLVLRIYESRSEICPSGLVRQTRRHGYLISRDFHHPGAVVYLSSPSTHPLPLASVANAG